MSFFSTMPLLLSIFIPAFTMRLFAEEFKTGTMEILATLPLTDSDIVLGKFGTFLAVWLLMVGLTLVHVVLLVFVGPPDLGQVAASLMGLTLLGAFYGSMGLLASVLTRSQVVAFLLGFLFCFAFFLVGESAEFVPGFLGQLLSFLGASNHFDGFLKGVVDTRDVLYYVSGTTLILS